MDPGYICFTLAVTKYPAWCACLIIKLCFIPRNVSVFEKIIILFAHSF